MMLCRVTDRLTPLRTLESPARYGLVVLRSSDGGRFAAADCLDCAPGERVLAADGDAARALLGGNAPVDALVVAVLESEPG